MDFILYKLYAIIYGCLHENDGGKSESEVGIRREREENEWGREGER